jgi:hypothetical protein
MTLRCLVGILISIVFVTACDGSCEDGGRTYEDGEQWDCSDGCNYCACQDGTVSSTAMGCGSADGDAGAGGGQ